jgi:hypothetical protein
MLRSRISTSTPRSPTASCATTAWKSASGIFLGRIDPSFRGDAKRLMPSTSAATSVRAEGAGSDGTGRRDHPDVLDGEPARQWPQPRLRISKAARIALGRAIARSGEEKGIRCNVISRDSWIADGPRRQPPDRAVTVPFGRQGTGWEVAYAALFLISNESSYVNAHTLFLDAATWRVSCGARMQETNGSRHCRGHPQCTFQSDRSNPPLPAMSWKSKK